MVSAVRISTAGIMATGQLHPAAGLTIDWTHPLAFGLQAFILPDGCGNLIDLAKPRMGGSGGTSVVRARGIGVTPNVTIAANVTGDLNFTAAPFTVACVSQINSSAGATSLFARMNYVSEGNNQGWALYFTSSFIGAIFNNNSAASYANLTASGLTNGTHAAMMTTDGTTKTLYIDGVSGGTQTTGNLAPASAAGPLNNTSDTMNHTTTELHVGAAWTRCLTPMEAQLWARDPMCMTIPVQGNWSMLKTAAAAFQAAWASMQGVVMGGGVNV